MTPPRNNLALAIQKAMGEAEYAISRLLDWKPFSGKPKPEAAICLAFSAEMRKKTLSGAYRGIWFHIPNEGRRGRAEAALTRAMGLIPGVPDYVLIWRGENDRLRVVFIEFKAPGKKETDNQTFFASWCRSMSLTRLLCYASDEALGALRELGAFS
jgi:hypothetical protein